MKNFLGLTKSTVVVLVLFFTLSVLLLVFQNCSGMKASNYNSGDVVSEGEEGETVIPIDPSKPPTPLPNNVGITFEFKAGDIYQNNTLVHAESFIDTLIKKYDYQNFGGAKAIAVALNGLGYTAISDVQPQSEVNKMALESCNLLSGMECAVIIERNTFVISKKDLPNSLSYLLDGYKGKTFDASEIPLASKYIKEQNLIKDYVKATGHKALALSITGGVYATFTNKWSYTPEEAIRMVLQQCEMQSALAPCILYAVNKEVVFDPRNWLKQSKINFNNNNVLAFPPPAQKNQSVDSIKEYIQSLDKKKYAIIITPNSYGYFGYDENSKDVATKNASDLCESGVHGTRCILYATSSGVVMTPGDLVAKKDYGDLFCKVVRSSCVEHFNMGCAPNKNYWIQDNASKEAVKEQCTSS